MTITIRSGFHSDFSATSQGIIMGHAYSVLEVCRLCPHMCKILMLFLFVLSRGSLSSIAFPVLSHAFAYVIPSKDSHGEAYRRHEEGVYQYQVPPDPFAQPVGQGGVEVGCSAQVSSLFSMADSAFCWSKALPSHFQALRWYCVFVCLRWVRLLDLSFSQLFCSLWLQQNNNGQLSLLLVSCNFVSVLQTLLDPYHLLCFGSLHDTNTQQRIVEQKKQGME